MKKVLLIAVVALCAMGCCKKAENKACCEGEQKACCEQKAECCADSAAVVAEEAAPADSAAVEAVAE